MRVSDFDYDLPEELIAQRPLPERDASRMLVADRREHSLRHGGVSELPQLLRPGDLLVLNNSRVVPARLFGQRGNGEPLEVLVVEPADAPQPARLWRCLLKRARRMRDGERIFFGMQATATVRSREGSYLLLQFAPGALELAMEHHGVPPLPPYIRREGFDAYTREDRERYQTVYAQQPGSAAAPTAGLHLSPTLLEAIAERGVQLAHVTLHVGIDTFTPVRAEETAEHRMHGERVEVPISTAEAWSAARRGGGRVIAVGTTTTRALESAAARAATEGSDGAIAAGSWVTDLFITPGYEFRAVDGMLTNFHQPKSTLLMMVSAFAGIAFIRECYAEAIRERYRFFSFGDCMLLL